LTTDQRSDLEARVRSGRGRANATRRARVILLLADGCSYATIAAMTGCSSRTIALWKQRFAKDGLAIFASEAQIAARTGGGRAVESGVFNESGRSAAW
jgi:transposase